MRGIVCGLKMFWFGLWHRELFDEHIFTTMSKLLEAALLVSTKDRPKVTHLFLNNKRIVSFWMYPGLSKNPVDRIQELLNEIDALKEITKGGV